MSVVETVLKLQVAAGTAERMSEESERDHGKRCLGETRWLLAMGGVVVVKRTREVRGAEQ